MCVLLAYIYVTSVIGCEVSSIEVVESTAHCRCGRSAGVEAMRNVRNTTNLLGLNRGCGVLTTVKTYIISHCPKYD